MTPTYYAGGVTKQDYVVTGRGFVNIPSNAVAIIATNNDLPLQNIDSESEAWISHITEKTDLLMKFEQPEPHSYSREKYLGAIVSNDRTIVYWVNDTKPLPVG